LTLKKSSATNALVLFCSGMDDASFVVSGVGPTPVAHTHIPRVNGEGEGEGGRGEDVRERERCGVG
jgi:hypothetical protein